MIEQLPYEGIAEVDFDFTPYEGKKIFLHCCCGPCATLPIKMLQDAGIDCMMYYYNPNIHPYQEFQHRLESFKLLGETRQIPYLIDDRYTIEAFLEMALAKGENRCDGCYQMRLEEAARVAKEQGCDFYTTSLLISPYQRHDVIKEQGEAIGKKLGIPFFYLDFRPYFRQGQSLAREMGLYMQKYCGCILSERDRYEKKKKA